MEATMQGIYQSCEDLGRDMAYAIAGVRQHDDYQGQTKIESTPFGAKLHLNRSDADSLAFGIPIKTIFPVNTSSMPMSKIQTACKNLRSSDILMSNWGNGVVIDITDSPGPFGCRATVTHQ